MHTQQQSIIINGDTVIRSDSGINMTNVLIYVEMGAHLVFNAPTVTLRRGPVSET